MFGGVLVGPASPPGLGVKLIKYEKEASKARETRTGESLNDLFPVRARGRHREREGKKDKKPLTSGPHGVCLSGKVKKRRAPYSKTSAIYGAGERILKGGNRTVARGCQKESIPSDAASIANKTTTERSRYKAFIRYHLIEYEVAPSQILFRVRASTKNQSGRGMDGSARPLEGRRNPWRKEGLTDVDSGCQWPREDRPHERTGLGKNHGRLTASSQRLIFEKRTTGSAGTAGCLKDRARPRRKGEEQKTQPRRRALFVPLQGTSVFAGKERKADDPGREGRRRRTGAE